MRKRRLKVGLFSPPIGHQPVVPPLGLASLKAFLGKKEPEVEVIQKDLSAIAVNYLLSGGSLRRNGFSDMEIWSVEHALSILRSEAAYRDFPGFHRAKMAVEGALRRMSSASREKLLLRGNTLTYTSGFPYRNRNGILAACEDANLKLHLFHDFYTAAVIPFVAAGSFDVVGLSVSTCHQLIPSFVLSRLLKRQVPGIKIVLGGAYVSRLTNPFSNSGPFCADDETNRRLFDIIDYVIVYEGETSLSFLIESIRSNLSPDFNKLIWKKGERMVANTSFSQNDIIGLNGLPTPDFEGLFTDFEDNEVYWTPYRVIPLMPLRGCAHNCRFCSNDNNADNNAFGGFPGSKKLRKRDVALVVRDVQELKQKNRTRFFSFACSNLHRTYLAELSGSLRSEGIIWEGFARIDDFIAGGSADMELIRSVAQSGCRYLQFGIESADDRTIRCMNKKSPGASAAAQVLRETARAGIMNHVFVMIGYPAGQPDDSSYFVSNASIIGFLEDNRDFFVSCKVTRLIVPTDLPDFIGYVKGRGIRIKAGEKDELLLYHPYTKTGKRNLLDEAIAELVDYYVHCVHPANVVSNAMIGPQRIFITTDEFWDSVGAAKNAGIPPYYDADALPAILKKLEHELGREERRLSQGVPSGERRERGSPLDDDPRIKRIIDIMRAG